MESDNLLITILEWAWVGLFGVFIALYRKITGIETRQELLDQAQTYYNQLRKEDLNSRNDRRKTIIERIDLHHSAVVGRIERLEKLIRNGHD